MPMAIGDGASSAFALADATDRENRLTASDDPRIGCRTEDEGCVTVAARHVVAGLHGRFGHVAYLAHAMVRR